uniref:Dehydrogenase/reductase (SDR family) member 4 n=1 Tax=Sus scrofa TaxID=9823 RepID=A0A8D1AQQ9_PIG
MRAAGQLLRACSQTWKSVRMASTGVERRKPLENKVALVTASTDGIGLAIARRLAQDGAHVVVSSRKQENVDRTVATLQGEGLSVTGTVCHVGKAEDRERLVAMAVNLHGGVDILVSNAAVNPFFGNIIDATEEVWDKILHVNVKATVLMTKAVVPEMEKRGGGSVLIVSSVGAYHPFPNLGPYNVSKTALLGLTKNLAVELAPRNIRVNCLAPGLIKTNFSQVQPWIQTRPPHDCFLRCTVRLRNSDSTQATSLPLTWGRPGATQENPSLEPEENEAQEDVVDG